MLVQINKQYINIGGKVLDSKLLEQLEREDKLPQESAINPESIGFTLMKNLRCNTDLYSWINTYRMICHVDSDFEETVFLKFGKSIFLYMDNIQRILRYAQFCFKLSGRNTVHKFLVVFPV